MGAFPDETPNQQRHVPAGDSHFSDTEDGDSDDDSPPHFSDIDEGDGARTPATFATAGTFVAPNAGVDI